MQGEKGGGWCSWEGMFVGRGRRWVVEARALRGKAHGDECRWRRCGDLWEGVKGLYVVCDGLRVGRDAW